MKEATGVPRAEIKGRTGDLFGGSSVQSTEKRAGGRSAADQYMGKYGELARFLEGYKEPVCGLKFKQVEDIIGSKLPMSARQRRTGWLWWTNESSRTQARNGWMAAGWIVSNVDYAKGLVLLRRTSP